MDAGKEADVYDTRDS